MDENELPRWQVTLLQGDDEFEVEVAAERIYDALAFAVGNSPHHGPLVAGMFELKSRPDDFRRPRGDPAPELKDIA